MNQIFGRAFRQTATPFLVAAVVLPLAAAAQTPPPAMLRTWTAPPGGTVQTVNIAGTPGHYTINIGAPCAAHCGDWGAQPLTIYAPNAGSPVGPTGSAVYVQNAGAISRIIVVQLMSATVLRVQVLTKFRAAGSRGRSNYATTQNLH